MSAALSPARRVAANVLRQLTSSVVGMSGGVLLSILIARTLGPSEMGSYALALIVVSTVQTVAGFGLARTALKFTAASTGPEAAGAVWWLLWRRSLSAVVAAVLLVAATPLLATFFRDPRLAVLLPIGAGILVTGLIAGVLESALEGRSRFDLLARSTYLLTPLHVVATLAALALGARAGGVMLAQVAFGAVNLLVLLAFARRADLVVSRPAPLAPALRRRIFRFARHGYWLSLLTFVVHDRIELLLLGALATTEVVSFYSVALGAAEAAMGLGPSIISAVFFPLLVSAWSGSDSGSNSGGNSGGDRALGIARYGQCLRYMALAAAPLALGGVAVAEVGVAVVFGPDYAPMVPVLRITLLSAAALAMAQGPTSVLMAIERQDWLLRVRGVLAVANLGLDVVLVPRFAAVGAAWANLAVAAAEVLLLGLVAWRLAGARPSPATGVPFLAAGLAAVAARLVLGARTDLLSLAVSILVAVPVYAAALVAGRFFSPADAALLGQLVPTPARAHQPVG